MFSCVGIVPNIFEKILITQINRRTYTTLKIFSRSINTNKYYFDIYLNEFHIFTKRALNNLKYQRDAMKFFLLYTHIIVLPYISVYLPCYFFFVFGVKYKIFYNFFN